MPEYPDIEAYAAALRPLIVGENLLGIRMKSPFLLRTVTPALTAFHGRKITAITRMGKRIVFAFEGEFFLCLHLMVAGRLQFKPLGSASPGKIGLAAFDFASGTLLFTEAGTKKRASLHAFDSAANLATQNPGGLEVMSSTPEAFASALRRENHTLKRSLTDPRLFSGIGNAYSDEILHHARLSPIAMTAKLTEAEITRLHASSLAVLQSWRDRLVSEALVEFPVKVTAFRPDMAAHGRFGLPCPRCGETIQRIRYADNETDYCPACQTGGKLLADRSLSRLLGKDWPKTVTELEEKWATWGRAETARD
jgi:formamidopyrimidine-DNA glycosylase